MNVTTTLTSDTPFEYDNPSMRYAFLLVVMIITMIAILIGNSLVIWAVYKHYNLQTPTNYILTGLAVTDLLSGLISIPLELYNRQEGSTCSFLLTTVLSLLSYLFGLNRGLHFIAATTDRYVAVTRPLRYGTLVTTRRVIIFVGIAWMVSLIVIGFAYSIFAVASVEATSIRCTGEHYTDPVQQAMLYLVASTIALFCVTLLILNLRILQIAIKQSRRIADVQVLFGQGDGARVKVKAVKTTLVIVGVFCICWLPTSLSHTLVVNVDLPRTAYIVILDGAFVMISFYSAINPFVYCYLDRSFRHVFLEAVRPLMKIFRRKSGQASMVQPFK